MILRPFWRYYGGKWRAAPRYPKPQYDTIIEPFAGSAGYSLRYPDREVILVEKYHVIAEIWRWLIGVSADEVMAIPAVDAVADLPEWVPQAARWLVGMCMRPQSTRPSAVLAEVLRRRKHSPVEGWTLEMRARVAAQVGCIRHWKIIEGDYTLAPDIEATWFVDPPYQGKPGRRYVCSMAKLDFSELATWCRSLGRQTIVCESTSATWIPFVPFGETRGMTGAPSREAIWYCDDDSDLFGWDPPHAEVR